MISSTTIEAIRELPIEQVVKDHVTLKKSGGAWMQACCPFHNEKTPSFKINIQKNTWTCFGGCGHGDAIEFVMRIANLPFIEACEQIANNHGIEIKKTDKKGKTPEQKADEQIMLHLVHKANLIFTSILNPQPNEL